ncbi:MarR family transcriptional regulator [Rhizobium leguminosarum]|uniref:MarR family transcriptional regulator n=1 Tax=Rhizobium leguminosarum TaxID=384 RepID=A0A4Q8XNQ4_RHILE|nr:MarR family transcriptional regulator [Rhizobium leguminosarum]TAX63647.1 MarR family transcriptional regulator [Rhizobium leguminosarum]
MSAVRSIPVTDEDSPLPQGVFESLAGIRLAMRRFLAFSEALLSQWDVTSQQYQAMLAIKASASGQMMVRELADIMLLQHHGAVQLADRLSAAGLVARVPSSEDKRSVLIALTSAGDELLASLAKVHMRGMLANEPLLVESLARLGRLAELGAGLV